MKRELFYLFFLAFLSLSGKAQGDREVYERYCAAMKEKTALPAGGLMVETAVSSWELLMWPGHWRKCPKD